MRYYVYISASKVDMIYTQIPKKLLKNIAGKLTIDFKLIKTEFSESPPRETLIHKLNIVEKYILDNKQVGTTADSKSYIKDTLNMKWGPFSEEMVYFACHKENFVMGLGGSLNNVLGNVGKAVSRAHSTSPYIVAALKDKVIENDALAETGQSFESTVLSAVKIASAQMEGIEEKLSFLAKRLFPGDKGNSNQSQDTETIILGTPIYVALED